MTAPTSTQIPGYVVGTWDIDPVHSDVSFTVRHMMVSKVRGRLGTFSGEIVTAAGLRRLDGDRHRRRQLRSTPATPSATATSAPPTSSRSRPTRRWTFRCTAIRADGDDYALDGELTIKGVTRPVTFSLEVNGFGPDAYGGTRAGFSATTTINRSDFGVDIAMPLDGGGVVVSEKVQVALEIEAVLRQS